MAKRFRLWLFISVALFCGGAAMAQQSAPSDYIVARDTPSWFKSSFLDFQEDVAEATETNKRVMIYFGQDDCPYCKRLHETSFKDEEIMRFLISNFDSIAVNIFGDVETVWTDGEEATEKELSARLKVQFTPTLLFLDEAGNAVVRVNGYRPPEWMRAALRYVAEKKEQQGITFEEYMRQHAPPSKTEAADAPVSDNQISPPDGVLHAPGKKTMVFVSQTGCAMCTEWNDYIQKNAKKWSDAFHIVKINRYGDRIAAKGINETQWARQMQIAFTPALIFLEADGTELFRAEAYLRPFHLDTVIEYARAGAATADPEFQRFLQTRADTIRENGGTVSIW